MSYQAHRAHFLLTIKGLRDILNAGRHAEMEAHKVLKMIIAVGGQNWQAASRCYPWLTTELLSIYGFNLGSRFAFSNDASQLGYSMRNRSLLQAALNDERTLTKLVDVQAVFFKLCELEHSYPDEPPRVKIITSKQSSLWINQCGDITH